jgi:multidrug efflux pump subunit AcrB
MRKIISYFIKYPVAVNVIILAVVVFGVVGIVNLKSSFFPLVDSQNISIQLIYPGASPREMEEGVVLKIEDNLRGLVGIDRVTSVSSENSATINVETIKGFDIDVVLADVKNAVDRVPSYPSGMEPPVVSKVESRRQTISFSVSGKKIPLSTLKQIARGIENDIRGMEGISQVTISGFPEEEIEIAVRENDLRAYNLTFADVAGAVSGANILTTGGRVKTDAEEYLIRANNRSYYGDELDFLVVRADENGRIIRLRDVATVSDKWSETPDRNYYNGEESVEVAIQSTNNEDLISSAQKVNDYVEKFNAEHDNVRLDIISDSSITLIQRTKLLLNNGGVGILLVLILLSLFLKPRIAFWVAFGLPISFLGMFMFATSANVTINVLSLFGMIIVIGILVDDAIVIGENIYHHYERGKSPIRAAIDGTMEVLPPIVSAILTTIVAFSTFFFLDGRVGSFFGEVATVVILTLAVSLVEALIILPAHIAHSKALSRDEKPFLLNVYADRFLTWMREKLYGPYLNFFLRNKFFGFAIPLSMLIVTMGALGGGIIRTTFFPAIASDRIAITLKMPQGTNEALTDSIITEIEQAAWAVDEEFLGLQSGGKHIINNITKRVGPGTSTASLNVNLLPGEERDFSSNVIANAIEEKMGPIYGAESVQYGSGSNFGGRPVSVSLIGNNIEEMKGAKEALKTALREIPRLKDISDNDPAGIKEIKITLKENAYLLGLTLNQVMAQVRSGFFGLQVQRFQRGQDEIRVWVRYELKNRQSIKQLDEMWIRTPSGQQVPLAEIANYDIERGEISINHLNGQREIKVEADLKDRKDSASEIVASIRANIMPSIQAKYPTISALYEGQNREANKTVSSAILVLPIILVFIYAIIAFAFRSYSQPLLLFLMVPFSLIGVAWGHWIHGFPVNILSWLGIIALIGIVVNDGLVLIGKFNLYLKEGMHFEEALLRAGKSRFRAIFLTSVTTIAGLAPLIFETSRQAQFLIPMAISIAYGIGLATFLTLLMLPILLYAFNTFKVYTKWLLTGKKPTREEVERAIIEMAAEQDEAHV